MTTTTFVLLGAVVFLLVMSAFFSGSETALTAASRARMHQLQRGGDCGRARCRACSRRSDRLIGAMLLGNNLVNILASALATSVSSSSSASAGVAYATLVMTAVVVVFAEVLPKT